MNSILDSVKKAIFVEAPEFDDEIINHINSIFSVLQQLGAGPSEGFTIQDESATWEDFSTNKRIIAIAKNYVAIRVKLLFDPPESKEVLDCYDEKVKEYESNLVTYLETQTY